MNITDERVTAYLQGLYRPLNPFLSRLRAEAEEEGIPIILRDTETLVRSLLAIRRPERILEIGTAVGYSALCFAAAAPSCAIRGQTAGLMIKFCPSAREKEKP